jgi:tetratricopeptide (TPR) repeat protein
VAKKHKHKHHAQAVSTPAALRPRIERARTEGRTQQALELAKQLHKAEPSPANLELLHLVYLERARQLRSQGQTRDAVIVLEAALRLENPPQQWLEQVATELAQCGAPAAAMAVLGRIPDAPSVGRIRGHVADAAVGDPGSRSALPATLQTELHAVLEAFRLTEQGNDDAALAALQPIGLRSPYLEWKLLLRGLQAYYTNDDARAVENWQRLDPERLPARLAAPFRARIDSAFAAAQPPATQVTLQRQYDTLQATPMQAQLRHLRTALENKRSLAQAYRQMETLLPDLRRTAPNLVPRLAACLYWAILDTGPDDADRYARVFGPPPEDPHFHRIAALAFERAGQRQDAQKAWEMYEKDVAGNAEVWPGGQADRARALIWLRMGRNAVEAEDGQGPMPWDYFGVAPKLKPAADTCFRRSRDLAPDMREPNEALFFYHRDHDHAAKAEQAARALLERFPDDAPILEGLSDLRLERGDTAEALALMQRALHANPLDRRLRSQVAWLHAERARSLAQADMFDEARREIQAAGAFQVEAPVGLNCLRAAVEFKAKEPAAAEEVLQQAAAVGQPALLTAYAMLVDSIRLKVPPAVKKRFDGEFKTAVAGPADAKAALLVLAYAEALHEADVSYYGQKTHVKKLADYALKTGKADVPEDSVALLVECLIDLEAYGQAIKLARAAQVKFHRNPFFCVLEARCMVEDQERAFQPWRAASLLSHAERLAQNLPMDDRRRTLLDQIQELRREVAVEDPFSSPFSRVFDMGDAGGEEDDDFDDGW